MVAGKGLDFISSNMEAQRALMQLHPCKLMTLLESTAPTPALNGNGQTGHHSLSKSAAVPAQHRHAAGTDHASLVKAAPERSAYQDIKRAQVMTAPTHGYKLIPQLVSLAVAHPTA